MLTHFLVKDSFLEYSIAITDSWQTCGWVVMSVNKQDKVPPSPLSCQSGVWAGPDGAEAGCVIQWSWGDIWPQRPQPQLLRGKIKSMLHWLSERDGNLIKGPAGTTGHFMQPSTALSNQASNMYHCFTLCTEGKGGGVCGPPWPA